MSSRPIRLVRIEGDLDEDPSSRQSLLSGWRQDLIRKSRVLVVGAGALGNEIIKNLTLLGTGHIRVVDFDIVEGSNLSRAVLFTKADARKKVRKVDAIRRGVRRLDPYGYIEIEAYHTDIMDHGPESPIFKGVDVIFTALDNLEARLHVNAIAYTKRIPLIDGGMDGAMGHVQVVIPPYTSCLNCSVTDRDMKVLSERLKCEGMPLTIGQPKTPAVITTTSVIAGIMVHEYIKIIHGLEKFKRTGKWDERLGEPLAGKRLFINLANNVFIKYKVPISRTCLLHEQ
ncbi:MAG: ThiF family adenylyltransferase [Desulfurococcales archaeon]|nr:ThiF family adenylyltransferase [Desulfurococcales archaeon]